MNVSELFSERAMTIAGASGKGGINRKKSDAILDPRGFFAKNKRHLKNKMKTATASTKF